MTVDALLDRLGAEARTLVTEEQVELGPDEASLDLLQKIYRSSRQPMSRRMRAAIEALPYENAKLSAVAVGYLTGEDFYSRLERAIERSNGVRLIEAQAIEVDDGRR